MEMRTNGVSSMCPRWLVKTAIRLFNRFDNDNDNSPDSNNVR